MLARVFNAVCNGVSVAIGIADVEGQVEEQVAGEIGDEPLLLRHQEQNGNVGEAKQEDLLDMVDGQVALAAAQEMDGEDDPAFGANPVLHQQTLQRVEQEEEGDGEVEKGPSKSLNPRPFYDEQDLLGESEWRLVGICRPQDKKDLTANYARIHGNSSKWMHIKCCQRQIECCCSWFNTSLHLTCQLSTREKIHLYPAG